MSGYAGTGALVRLALRRDRLLIPLCVLGLVAFAGGSAKTTVDLYPGASAVDAARGLVDSPAIVALYGAVADPGNPDSFAVFKTLLFGAIALSIVTIVLVRRHTRSDEDAGRTELALAGAVGRRAPLAAALLVAVGTTVLTAALATASLVGAGLGVAGSITFGLAWAGSGLVFSGVTAVAAQLAATARGTAGLAFGALGLAYALRAVGDSVAGVGWLTWLSPLGWAEELRTFGANRWWVGVLPLVAFALLVATAVALLERRDLGAGLLPTRPGPGRAAASLRTPFSLAWRLQRGPLAAWVAGYLVLGLVLGAVSASVGSVANTPQIQDLLRQLGGDAGSLSDAFLAAEIQFLAVAAAAYGIAAALRLHAEEEDGHTEQVLATATTRRAWLAAHGVIAMVGSALLMVVVALALSVGQGGGTGRVLVTALATVPAIWVCVGLALALYGAWPRVTGLAWAALALFVAVGLFGDVFDLPGPIRDLSPFTHVLVVPGASVVALPLVVLTVLGAVLVTLAQGSFRVRDVG